MNHLQLAIEQIIFARKYTIGLLDQTSATEWFRLPTAGVSHVAWQVGHIALAEYRLALLRIRGTQPQDEALVSQEFTRLFGLEPPQADPGKYPTQAEIRAALDKVHEQVLQELPSVNEADLDQPVPYPHPLAKTKLQALLWCAHHEMLHAGQIGLLRRQLGYPPMW
jgi:hypothetical protein